jgi:hypothetical protein
LKVLRENKVPDETKLHALQLLQKLAGDSRQVPKSYLVGKLTRFKVDKQVIAGGRVADIREGRFRGMVVAVKTVRTSRETKVDLVHEVGGAAGCSILVD